MGIFMNPVPAVLIVWVRPDAVLCNNIAFAIPSIALHTACDAMVVQADLWMERHLCENSTELRHLYAIRDKLMGSMVIGCPQAGLRQSLLGSRVPSLLCGIWTLLYSGALVSGCTPGYGRFSWFSSLRV
jgi:hypothetical protein